MRGALLEGDHCMSYDNVTNTEARRVAGHQRLNNGSFFKRFYLSEDNTVVVK